MKSYNELSNSKRTQCSIKKDKIGVELYKLMSNSTFGRQMENVKKIQRYSHCKLWKKGKKVAPKSTFRDVFILSCTVPLYDMKKGTVLLDKPIQIGFDIYVWTLLKTKKSFCKRNDSQMHRYR